MKISPKKSPKKPLLIAGLIFVLLGGTGGYYWYLHRQPVADASSKTTVTPTNTVNYQPATAQEKADSAAAKQDIINNTDQPATSGTISVTISRASQVGTAISVRTVVTGTQDGSCDMTFTMNGKATVTKNFAIVQGPTSATCNGDIPVSAFPAAGDWTLSVVAKNITASSPAVTQKPVTVTQ